MLHVLQSMRDSIESGKTIEGDDVDTSSEESPTTYIWLLYLIAQVYLHLSQFQTALQTIDVALSHTPVLPELWMIKARAHKRSGDIYAAEDAMATARSLDGQDRFLNGKHVKYLLRIDAIEEAESTAGLFTRKDASSPLQDLTDMQCMWFLVEEAEAYKRKGDLGMALKRYHTIEKIFSEIYEDEFDFHAYCMRKFTLRACVK
jgi:peptide alpha-N-acetyltransferase